MMRVTLVAAAGFAIYAQDSPPLPVGLWQSKDQGFVIRIQPCGAGFCGFAAGAPESKAKPARADICGKQMLKNFVWNSKAQRWEGRMQPPNTAMDLATSVTSDGTSFLTLRGRMLVLSKTMAFVPFTGKIGEGCRLDQEKE